MNQDYVPERRTKMKTLILSTLFTLIMSCDTSAPPVNHQQNCTDNSKPLFSFWSEPNNYYNLDLRDMSYGPNFVRLDFEGNLWCEYDLTITQSGQLLWSVTDWEPSLSESDCALPDGDYQKDNNTLIVCIDDCTTYY